MSGSNDLLSVPNDPVSGPNDSVRVKKLYILKNVIIVNIFLIASWGGAQCLKLS